MVPITERAKAYLGGLTHSEEGMVWVVCIRWDRGDSDNRRSTTGEVIWEHSGPRGWTVELGGYLATKVTAEWANPIAPGVFLEMITHGHPFPDGGAIDFENGHLFLRKNAV